MLKLIKLEWKKNNIGKYIRNAVILRLSSARFCLHWRIWELQMIRTPECRMLHRGMR